MAGRYRPRPAGVDSRYARLIRFQSPMPKRMSRAEWERFLAGRHVAVLATLGPEGRPVLTPIWYLYRDGLLHMRTGMESIKARNVRRDQRVTVCVQDERPPYKSVTIHGLASIEPEKEGLDAAIARRYLGAVGRRVLSANGA